MSDDERREVARRLRELNFSMSYRSKRDMCDALRRVVGEYNDRPFGGVYTFSRLADLIEPDEPPYNLYTLYEAVFHRSPRCWECIEDDEVDELVDAMLDICNVPGHELIQRPQPSCDRDALMELADELSGDTLAVPAVYGTYLGGYVAACRDAARRIREALGATDG